MKLIQATNSKTVLEYFILKVLKVKYSNAIEIESNLNSFNINYNKKDFFPILSHLFLNKYLCYNWIRKENTEIKYYHITPSGANYLSKINITR